MICKSLLVALLTFLATSVVSFFVGGFILNVLMSDEFKAQLSDGMLGVFSMLVGGSLILGVASAACCSIYAYIRMSP